jgi:hypothetical protein
MEGVATGWLQLQRPLNLPSLVGAVALERRRDHLARRLVAFLQELEFGLELLRRQVLEPNLGGSVGSRALVNVGHRACGIQESA